MCDNLEIDNLPQDWKTKEYEITGQTKLYAVFKHKSSDREVHVVPYKYGLPGFTNAHRVTVEDPDNGLKLIAEGLEVETVEEAKEAAILAIESS